MADNSPAGRRRALRRTGIASAVLLAGLDVALWVTGQRTFAFILTVFGPLLGVAVYDAGHCRIELQRYRDKYGTLPTEDDE